MSKEAALQSLPGIEKELSAQIIPIEEFDVDAFFSDVGIFASDSVLQDGVSQPFHSPLLAQLHRDAEESVPLLEKKLTRDRLASGLNMSLQVLGSLTNLGGSCGVFCMHGLGSVAQVAKSSSGLGSGFGIGGFGGGRTDQKKARFDDQRVASVGKQSARHSAQVGRSLPTHRTPARGEGHGNAGESWPALFGFPLIDVFIDAMLPTPPVHSRAA